MGSRGLRRADWAGLTASTTDLQLRGLGKISYLFQPQFPQLSDETTTFQRMGQGTSRTKQCLALIVVIVDSHHQCNVQVREESRPLTPETLRPQAAVTSRHQCA